MEQYYHQRPRNRRRRRRSWIIITALILVFSAAILTTVKGASSGQKFQNDVSPLKLVSALFPESDVGPVETVSIPVDIIASYACVINAGTSGTLYQKSASEQIAPASTAKLLTALTVLDYLSPDDLITVGTEIEAMAEDSSRVWLYVGDTLTVRQLLIALLLPSGNDAAYTIAENACEECAKLCGYVLWL